MAHLETFDLEFFFVKEDSPQKYVSKLYWLQIRFLFSQQSQHFLTVVQNFLLTFKL